MFNKYPVIGAVKDHYQVTTVLYTTTSFIKRFRVFFVFIDLNNAAAIGGKSAASWHPRCQKVFKESASGRKFLTITITNTLAYDQTSNKSFRMCYNINFFQYKKRIVYRHWPHFRRKFLAGTSGCQKHLQLFLPLHNR